MADQDGQRALLEVTTEKKIPVLPIVPGGRGLDEIIA